MRLLLIKERLFLFGEFAVSKSQYLYNKKQYSSTVMVMMLMTYNEFGNFKRENTGHLKMTSAEQSSNDGKY